MSYFIYEVIKIPAKRIPDDVNILLQAFQIIAQKYKYRGVKEVTFVTVLFINKSSLISRFKSL